MDEIIVQVLDEKLTIVVLEESKIVELYEYDLNNKSKIGNIYIGEVKNVIPKNNSLFVDIGSEKAGFLQLETLDKTYKNGDKIIVQVRKDEYDSKGAKLSNKLSIAGKYIVLLINSDIITYSDKIKENKNEEFIKKIREIIPSNFGAIVRTESHEVSEDVIIEELKELLNKYNTIIKNIQKEEVQLIYESSSIEKKLLLEFVKKNTKKIYINDEKIYTSLLNEIDKSGSMLFSNSIKPEIVFSKINFIEEFGLVTEYEKASQRKIWLKSSGYITIDKTEAMTVIDVNSGKFLGKKDYEKEDTVFDVNKEAAIEIMKHLRLKNIGGIIIVDFINLAKEEEREALLAIMEAEKQHDRSRVDILGFTKLGLCEITRKKQ